MSIARGDQIGADERDALLLAIEDSPSYRLAHEDTELLANADLRPLRLQLEMLKPERQLRRHKVQSTVICRTTLARIRSGRALKTVRHRLHPFAETRTMPAAR